MKRERYSFTDLIEIMRLLRGGEGCPWDREQTHGSLRRYLIEETYEVLETIDEKDSSRMCEELGDLLLQVVFHAQIASENGSFDVGDVIDGISRKLVKRHTHVFGDDKAETPNKVISNWESIKKKEKGIQLHTDVLRDVPRGLPALMRSCKVQRKAAQVGFDWDNIEDVFNKVLEEAEELGQVYKSKNVERITDEIGDMLFSVVNLARFLDVEPELALSGTIEKFIDRFEYVECRAAECGRKMKDMSLKELDGFWEEAKEAMSGNPELNNKYEGGSL